MTEVDVERPTSSATPSPRARAARLLPEGCGTPLLLAVAWAGLVAASVLNRADFWSQQTLLAVTFTMAIPGVLAVGEALVAISGGFLDISIGASMIMAAYVGVLALRAGIPDLLAVLIMIGVGAAWGLVNATIIVFGRINPIIVTLATMFVGVAAMYLLFQSAQPPREAALSGWGSGTTFGLPNIFWPMVLLIAVVGFFLPRTRYGRRAIAVGGSAPAAKARGVSLRKTRFAIFTACGACCGVAGVLFAAAHASFTPDSGSTYLLRVVSAVILAGVWLSGGRGNIWTLFLSVGFLSTAQTALVFFGLSSDWQMVFAGSILIVAVSLDGYRRQRRVAA